MIKTNTVRMRRTEMATHTKPTTTTIKTRGQLTEIETGCVVDVQDKCIVGKDIIVEPTKTIQILTQSLKGSIREEEADTLEIELNDSLICLKIRK
jgi:hypothetical protein